MARGEIMMVRASLEPDGHRFLEILWPGGRVTVYHDHDRCPVCQARYQPRRVRRG